VAFRDLINNKHAAIRNPPMLFQQMSVSRNIDSGTVIEKSAQLASIFIEEI
jgi:hypothetical protein